MLAGMAESYEVQLERVQTLIGRIEESGVQGYSVGGQTYTKADLKTLYDRETVLLRRIKRRQDDGSRAAEVEE